MKLTCLLLLCGGALWGQSEPDTMLKAMKDEMERGRTLEIAGLDKPYFLEYIVEDLRTYSVSASLGGILAQGTNRVRVPRTRVRVGDYIFDNSNYLYSDAFSGGAPQLAIDDDYGILRRSFWLSTDSAFKGAVEAISRKRAALKNLTQVEKLPDFWKAEPVVSIRPMQRSSVTLDEWTARVRDMSKVFSAYPEVLSSRVSFDGTEANFYLVNSEGTTLRHPDFLYTLQIRAEGQAPDGMKVRAAAIMPVLDVTTISAAPELLKVSQEVAGQVKALAGAPSGESYSGPVLFEGVAGAQIIADVLAPHFALPRRPVGEPGRTTPFLPSEFESRLGLRVLPEFLDVVDDPTQKFWKTTPLLGFYEFDYEGVVPAPLTLVDKGYLKNYLLTRQAVKGFESSNGRARVPGAYGAIAAAISNLFVRSSESVKSEELRARLIKMVQDRGKPYGIIVRRMDFPTTAPRDELRRVFSSAAQSGDTRPVSTPALVYRVYPDGKEELIRGLRLRRFNIRTLRDIVAVSDEKFTFHFMNTLAPMSMPGPGYVAPASVIAPSLLFEDVEMERPQEELQKLPVVPPPPLTAAR